MKSASTVHRIRGPRMFVAMPFGCKAVAPEPAASGLETEQLPGIVDFDEVWRMLIKPALEHAGCQPYRADEEPSAGDIRTDMFFELVTGEFVLADISTLNANVFYELGVRHGVSPRGVLMIDGGWCRRPFDVAPDRTFSYEGCLFQRPQADRGKDWNQAVELQIVTLAQRLQAAMQSDESTTSSPVYKELVGLRPVDWSRIQNAKARYFGCQLSDWHSRVRKAKRQSQVGDILTLSRDAPNQMIEWQLRGDAARALFDLGSYERAHELFRFIVQENPDNAAARYGLAKTLDQLARRDPDNAVSRELQAQAEVEIEEAVRRGGDNPEAYNLLGRIYKYRWRFRWENPQDDTKSRRQSAARHWEIAEKALRHYQEAQTLDLGLFHAGVNVISLQRLRDFLCTPEAAEREPTDPDLVGMVRVAARGALERGRRIKADEAASGQAVWAHATLGEVALLTGDSEAAESAYRAAANDPDASVTQLKSFDDQLAMYEGLGFEPGTVQQVRAVLTEQLTEHRVKRFRSGCFDSRADRRHTVIAFRGAVFEDEILENRVCAQLDEQLERWQVGEGDIVICGARRGSEIIFADRCVQRGATVRLLLPLKRAEFVSRSVRCDRADWERRFYTLLDQCEVLEQPTRLGATPVHLDPYDRNNLWCLDLARTELGPDLKPRVAVLLVDGTGEGSEDERGLLRHFVEHAQELDLLVEEVVVRMASSLETTQFPTAAAVAVIRRKNGNSERLTFALPLTVGRAENNDVVLSDGRTSRQHLRLEPRADGLHLNNLSRRQGATFLDDLEIDPSGVVWMTYGQTIRLVDGTTLTVEGNT